MATLFITRDVYECSAPELDRLVATLFITRDDYECSAPELDRLVATSIKLGAYGNETYISVTSIADVFL